MKKDPIKLYVVGAGWGIPFASSAPFPLKLETWLRMTGIPHEVVVENDMSKGPKKKTPWIVDGGHAMGDSELIIAYLKQRDGVDPDKGMSKSDRAIATALHRMIEEHYHQVFEHHLFFGPGGEERLAHVLGQFPAPLRPIVRLVIRRTFQKQLYARGVCRHTEDEILAMGKADLDAASAFLGDKPYLFGDEPRTIDATLFGFLGVSIYVAGDNPLFRYAASLDNLRAYTERMQARYFPETLKAKVAASVAGSTANGHRAAAHAAS